jgi:hypothetical protein
MVKGVEEECARQDERPSEAVPGIRRRIWRGIARGE